MVGLLLLLQGVWGSLVVLEGGTARGPPWQWQDHRAA